MREDWRYLPLGQICRIVGGGTPSKNETAYYGGDVPWATVRDMQGDVLSATEYCITEEAVARSATNIIPQGNIVIATRVGLGKMCLLAQDTAINQDLRGVLPKNTGDLDVRFLFRWLQSIARDIKRAGSGATVQGVKLTFVKALTVPMPTMAEQKRIVAILDEAFDRIDAAAAHTERNVASARELFECELNSTFNNQQEGWVDKKLGEIASIKHGFAFRSKYFTDAGDYVLLTPGNFFEEGGYRDRGTKQKYYVGGIPNGFILPKGALVVAMTEQAAGLLGSPAIIPEDGRFLHNQRLGLVEPRDGVPWCTNFFFHAFNANSFRQRVHLEASGVKVRHTSPKKLADVTLSFPTTVAQQQAVATKLDHLHQQTAELRSIYEEKLILLAEVKQSLLQKAFAGELTAKEAERQMAVA